MRLTTLGLVGALLLTTIPGAARADTDKARQGLSRISPAIPATLGSAALVQALEPHGAFDGTVPVSLRFATVAAREKFIRDSPSELVGEAKAHGPFVALRVTLDELPTLRTTRGLLRAELDFPPRHPPPLRFTTGEIEVPWLHEGLGLSHMLSGRNIRIADIDTGINVLHPAFFSANLGLYSWIDTDNDGRFRSSVDAVDLDGDGIAAPFEVGRIVFRRRHSRYTGSISVPEGAELGPGDIVYLDENGNQSRDTGRVGGFTDNTPAFSEPTFLIDDVNRNGRLDPREKLWRLGISKIEAVFNGRREFRRGHNLIDAPGAYDRYASHGSQVAGIAMGSLVGQDPDVGIAPAVSWTTASYAQVRTGFLPLLIWSLEGSPQIVLHEYAPWTGKHLDGSSNVERLMDVSSSEGILHVAPVGNLGGSDKEAKLSLSANAESSLLILVPGLNASDVELSLLWTEEVSLVLELEGPDGQVFSLGSEGASFELGGLEIIAYLDISPRGTRLFNVHLLGTVDEGEWTLRVINPDDIDATLVAHLFDNRSGWNRGIRFTNHQSEDHIVAFPATADSAIAVGAYAAYDEFPISQLPETSGELRSYSGRGRRIDGATVLDITAPDNPFTATSYYSVAANDSMRGPDLHSFSGTSGAAAHVAGVLALWREALPKETRPGLVARLAQAALADNEVALAGNDRELMWGAGKLRAYRGLKPSAPTLSEPPRLGAQTICLSPYSSQPPHSLSDDTTPRDSIRVRVDLGYDGSWDSPLVPFSELRLPPSGLGTHPALLLLVDESGANGRFLVELKLAPACDVESQPNDELQIHGGGCQTTETSSNWLWWLGMAFLFGKCRASSPSRDAAKPTRTGHEPKRRC